MRSLDIISCLRVSCKRAIGCVVGSAEGCVNLMRDHWENNLEEFKV